MKKKKTARDGINDRLTGSDAGADDYWVKLFGIEEVLSWIPVLLRQPNAILSIADLAFNDQSFSVVISNSMFKFLYLAMQQAEKWELVRISFDEAKWNFTHVSIAVDMS